jgi:hypothetical protein
MGRRVTQEPYDPWRDVQHWGGAMVYHNTGRPVITDRSVEYVREKIDTHYVSVFSKRIPKDWDI